MSPLTLAVSSLLTNTIFPIITAIVAAFVIILLRKLAAKLHISMSADTIKMIEGMAASGVGVAEEAALNAFKQKGMKITSDGKLDIAVAHVLGAIPSISRATAETYVHAALAKIGGVGATGEQKVISHE